ncbi:hypothetical protein Taro_002415 [Colocasia esculenta]|uniref:Uncharacterized protein n=1 Tax=Colocasia esculenta TaxID=4460 RepID=A0A843TNK4_COLES|nr:hypothetical protein [Colocasia esculenta]
MVAPERPAATELAVRVAKGVSIASLLQRSCRVAGSCSVDATYQATAFAFPVFKGSCLWRAVRGGDGHSYEKAPTGAFFVWRDCSGTLLGWKHDSLGGRDHVVTARPVATWSRHS